MPIDFLVITHGSILHLISFSSYLAFDLEYLKWYGTLVKILVKIGVLSFPLELISNALYDRLYDKPLKTTC